MSRFRSLLLVLAVSVLVPAASAKEWKDVADALGRAGAVQPDGVYKVSFPRSHMLDEQPRLFFMHFWANDDAQKLATALRSALDRMHTKK